MTGPDAQLAAIRDSFDARAPQYDASPMHRALATSTARFARVAEDAVVVDVATGTGLVARALAARYPGLRISGVDISGGMLAVARAALPSATWLQADAAALPIADASTDLVTCVTALHLFPDPGGAIAQWARILRPGGRVITASFVSAGHHTPHGEPGTVPYRRDHAPFATPERLQGAYAPFGLRIDRIASWARADDRILIAEAVRG
jgi:ubiquinone/menaquinone biosynthesis C-methylase UbiE